MILIIDMPKDLRLNELIKREDIPCFCEIATKFILTFDFAPFLIVGELIKWELEKINLRYPSRVGGNYSYYNHAMVSIDRISENKFKVKSLKFFENSLGWIPIIIAGDYAPEQKYDEGF